MPSEILRDRDHRHIGAEAERPTKARAAPGVVHGEQGGAPGEPPRQRGHVLDVVNDRSRIIQIDKPGFGFEAVFHLAVVTGIKFASNTPLGEKIDGNGPRWPVHRLG